MATAAVLLPAQAADGSSSLGVGYICGAEQAGSGRGPRQIQRAPGMGNSHLAIDAKPEAQAWFDYGLQLADGFYHEDAKAAFAKAVSLDPDCAACLWGEAWARGPTLNFDVAPAETQKALALAEKAETLARSDRDRALIAALKVRYADGGKDGKASGLAYAKAMDKVYRQYPEPEIGVVTAHALMIPARDDDTWGLERAIEILAAILKRDPDNAGAIHFYIHSTEFAGRAGMALPYAVRLPALAPSASHMVHMPGHTLFRMGRYEDAALLNARALGVEASYRRTVNAPGVLGTAAYYTHNFTFGLSGAMMAGDRDLALRFADHAKVAYPDSLTLSVRQAAVARSWAALGWFAPDRALALPEAPSDNPLLAVMRAYARGEAFAGKGDAAGVRGELKTLAAMKAPDGQPGNMLAMAKLVLDGRAAMIEGDTEQAVRAFSAAAALQDDKMRDFMDPPPWWYPTRRSLAAALLAQGRAADAAMEARRSLAAWPQDGLALKVLAEAEAKLGHRTAASAQLAQARRAYQGDLREVPLRRI